MFDWLRPAEIVSHRTKQAGSLRSGSVLQFALKFVFQG
jgi:hypothetical protein